MHGENPKLTLVSVKTTLTESAATKNLSMLIPKNFI